MINFGSNGGSDDGVFWQVGSSATLGTGTSFEGNILALASITLDTAATILNGRALAQTGAVTMDTNTISNVCPIGGPGNGGPGYSGGLEFNSGGNIVPIPATRERHQRHEVRRPERQRGAGCPAIRVWRG